MKWQDDVMKNGGKSNCLLVWKEHLVVRSFTAALSSNAFYMKISFSSLKYGCMIVNPLVNPGGTMPFFTNIPVLRFRNTLFWILADYDQGLQQTTIKNNNNNRKVNGVCKYCTMTLIINRLTGLRKREWASCANQVIDTPEGVCSPKLIVSN